MKKLLLLISVFAAHLSYAQWTPTGALPGANISRPGNVAIGKTTAPQHRLDVDGDVKIATAAYTGLILERYAQGGIEFQLKNTASTWSIASSASFNNTRGNLAFIQTSGDINNMKIGFGKIGTEAFIDIDSRMYRGIKLKRAHTAGGIDFTIENSSGSRWAFANGADGLMYLYKEVAPSSQSHKILVIGSPDEIASSKPWSLHPRLAVAGKILCEEVQVQLKSTWGDFVFADDYKLNSLNEVETFIRENKHLPGIPSADSISATGLALGEMQRLQMIKIEELTLHLIAMAKENQTLKAELDEVKEKQQKEIEMIKSIVLAQEEKKDKPTITKKKK